MKSRFCVQVGRRRNHHHTSPPLSSCRSLSSYDSLGTRSLVRAVLSCWTHTGGGSDTAHLVLLVPMAFLRHRRWLCLAGEAELQEVTDAADKHCQTIRAKAAAELAEQVTWPSQPRTRARACV